MNHEQLLDYYRKPGVFTTINGFEDQIDALPNDIATLTHAVQMLLVHRGWAPAYGLTLTPERETENGLHSTEAMLTRAMQLSPAKIGAVRMPDKRVVGICRHFSTMMAAFLKHKGFPARARCGFATYFEQGKYVDHWVAEYWNPARQDWIQVDAQLDTLQQTAKNIDFDPLDTPRDRFLNAGDVWLQYRAGKIDGDLCGIMHMWGDWYIRGNHALDLAALQNVELLPWEPFGIAKSPGSTIGDTPELLAVVDEVAALTNAADAAAITRLLAMAEEDERLRTPTDTITRAQAADATGTGTGPNPLSIFSAS